MQKIISLAIIANGINSRSFDDVKELNRDLEEGYKVVSITSGSGTAGLYSIFLILLEKPGDVV